MRDSGGRNADRPLVLSTLTGSPSQARLDELKKTIDKLHDTVLAAGIPVVLGEYGLLGFDKFTGTIEQGEKLSATTPGSGTSPRCCGTTAGTSTGSPTSGVTPTSTT